MTSTIFFLQIFLFLPVFLIHNRRFLFCFSRFTLVSKPAPHWEGTAVINGEFKEVKLSDYKGKYLVFFFYPLDLWVMTDSWAFFYLYNFQVYLTYRFMLFFCRSTFVCPTEIIAFSDRVHEFQAINTEVVACSVDSQFTHLAWYNCHWFTLGYNEGWRAMMCEYRPVQTWMMFYSHLTGSTRPGRREASDQWRSPCCPTSLTRFPKTMESTWRTRVTHWGTDLSLVYGCCQTVVDMLLY